MKSFKQSVYGIEAVLIGLFCLTLFSCENIIEYSPYQVKSSVTGKNRNQKAISRIKASSSLDFQPFKIALIGDSHTYYDDFKDQVKVLNSLDSIDFIVHMGDITLSGIYREFIWFGEIIDKLNKPIITIIGNHDCLANGEAMYYEMFGDFNFEMEYNNCKLVFFDNIIWERNVQDPDFEWLNKSLSNRPEYTHQFVFAHIPPWGEPFSIGNTYLYNYLMERHNVTLSVHGHMHKFSYTNPFGQIPYLVTGDSKDREIVVLEVLKDTVLVNRKFY